MLYLTPVDKYFSFVSDDEQVSNFVFLWAIRDQIKKIKLSLDFVHLAIKLQRNRIDCVVIENIKLYRARQLYLSKINCWEALH